MTDYDVEKEVYKIAIQGAKNRISVLETALREIERLSQRMGHFKTNLYAREIYWVASNALSESEKK